MPVNEAAVTDDKVMVRPTHSVGLSAEANVAVAGQWLRRMLHCLPKRRAAVAQAIDAGTHIEMSVEVEDAHLLARNQVAKIVAIGCFMSAAQDDGTCGTARRSIPPT